MVNINFYAVLSVIFYYEILFLLIVVGPSPGKDTGTQPTVPTKPPVDPPKPPPTGKNISGVVFYDYYVC